MIGRLFIPIIIGLFLSYNASAQDIASTDNKVLDKLGKEELFQMHTMGVKIAMFGEHETYVLPPLEKISVRKFKNVAVLDFSNLPIYTLPSWLGVLPELRVLNLNNTQLEQGELSKISGLSKVESLDISNNPNLGTNRGDTTLSDALSSLTQLRTLGASNIGASESSLGDIGKLKNLRELTLSKNNIRELDPLGLSALLLTKFDVSDNNISAIAKNSIPHASMQNFDIGGNSLVELPYINFPELRKLDVGSSTKMSSKYEAVFSLPKIVQVEINEEYVTPILRCKMRKNVGEPCGRKVGYDPEMILIPKGYYEASGRIGLDCIQITENCNTVSGYNVEAFYISKYELTFGDWKKCVEDNGCEKDASLESKSLSKPISIFQFNLMDYLEWVRAKTGDKYRLPTDTEWSHAAYSGIGSDLSEYGWIASNSRNFDEVRDVGSKKPNSNGLFDVIGNMSELVTVQYPTSNDKQCRITSSYGSRFDLEIPTPEPEANNRIREVELTYADVDNFGATLFGECSLQSAIGGNIKSRNNDVNFSHALYLTNHTGYPLRFIADNSKGKYKPSVDLNLRKYIGVRLVKEVSSQEKLSPKN